MQQVSTDELEQEETYLERLIRVDMESAIVICAVLFLTLGVSFILQSISLITSSFKLYYALSDISTGLRIGTVPVAMIDVYWIARWMLDWRKLKRIQARINTPCKG